MFNLYPGHKPSYGFGRLLVFLLFAVSFPCFLFAQPTIASFSPASGPVGAAVTITGTNFSATPSSNIVYFGTVQATVSAASATSLTATVPAGTSYQSITVTTGGLTAFSALPFITTFSDPAQFTPTAFAERTDLHTGQGPLGVAAADFDGDGKADLVVANGTDNSISVFKNNGVSGTISFALQYTHPINATVSDLPTAVATGDLDGDGKPDLVVVNNNSGMIAVIRNTSTTGSISFAAPIYYNVDNINSLPAAAAIADLNGDGKPEIIVAAAGLDVLSIYPNTSTPGNLSFSTNQDLSLPPGSGPIGVIVADLDGDGKPDLASANQNTNIVSVFRNTGIANGAISFATNVNFPTGASAGALAFGLAAGDLDGDGKADLVVTNYTDNTVSLLRNTGAPGTVSFNPGPTLPMDNSPQGIGIADLDGDGKPDLAITNWSDGKVCVFRNTSTSGNISMATGINYTVGAYDQYITVADLDGDGMPDLAVSNANDNSISVLRNKGAQGPVISSFTPVVGIAGTVVTITGTNLNGATAVSFGGTAATTFTIVSATTITATVGGGASGAVSVTTPSGTGSLNGFTFGQSVPVITSFTPSFGIAGTTVSITGSGLSAVSLINFGGVQTSYIVNSDNLITATVGTGATGKISIFSPYGADSLGTFTYSSTPPPPPLDITAFSPATGKTGDTIIIKGKYLTGTTAVSFGGTSAQSFNTLSDSVIVAIVGPGTTGQLLVTGASGMDSLPGFTYQPPPPPPVYQINSFSPTSGNEGTTITITGSHLTGATTVSFGGTPASFTVISDNTITAIIGPGSSGQVKVTSPSWQDSLAGFSFIQDTVVTPPPVQAPFQLLQFSVTLAGNQALVKWSALNEKSILHYEVDRGTDSTEFNVLTRISPNVKDAGTHNYAFTDTLPLPGISYYRIRMVDTSNSFTYSHTIALQIAVKVAVRLSMYPNPVKYGFTYVALPATGRPSRFEVADMLGKVIKTQNVSANTIQVRVDLSRVIRGTYKLIWTDGMNYSWQTLVVL